MTHLLLQRIMGQNQREIMLATKCSRMQQDGNAVYSDETESGWQEDLNRMCCKAALMCGYRVRCLQASACPSITLNLYLYKCS